MELGAFSVSLSVKNLQTSKVFYQKLGFEKMAGDEDQNWLILKNGEHVIGLFQGMFEGNMLTFNPGWNQSAEELDEFNDVRTIAKHLKEQGVELIQDVDAEGSGPGSVITVDPDGNHILFDQHSSKMGS